MSKYETIFPVMIIDDDSRYVEPQKDFAYTEFGLELKHYKYWDEAQAELTDNFNSYDAVIVDGKGQLSKDSKVEDPAHLSKVINWLKQEKGKGQIIPIFINTGFHDELSPYFNPDEDILGVYKKGENQTQNLFSAVRTAIEAKDARKFELMYPEVFSVFNNKYLPTEKRKQLTQALIACQNKACLKSDFNTVRSLLEAMYYRLKDANVLEDFCFSNGRPNFDWCYKRLSKFDIKFSENRTEPALDYAIFPKHVMWLVNDIKNVSSILSHDYNEDYTSFALRSITYGMMEVLIWFKKYLDAIES